MGYRQKRAGLNDNTFEILKFRTTHEPGPELEVPQEQPKDPRVTPLGRFLRSSSVDELPQLLNMLKGDVSLVGPQPEPPTYSGSCRIRPGLVNRWSFGLVAMTIALALVPFLLAGLVFFLS